MRSSTQRRQLHEGRSPWQDARVQLPVLQPPRRDRHCDVLVVGVGITGALVAESLASAGLHVICCDRRTPLQGSTAASTAMVLHEIDTPLSHLVRRMGTRDAHRIWHRSYLAVQALCDRARDLGIEADLSRQQSLYLQGDQLDARGLRREADARARAGIHVTYLTRAQVAGEYGISARAALRSHGALAAHPRRLAAGFLRAAVARGAELFAPAEIVEVKDRRDRAIATLGSGTRIAARHLVFATGYELPHMLQLRVHRIVSTWAIATRPQRRAPWPGPCLIWEASSPYLYLRTTADGRVLCGGADEPIADAARRQAVLGRKCRGLQRRLRGLLPAIDARMDYAWGGAFGVTADGLPRIGTLPGARRCHAVLGFGGNGITFSMMGAQMLRNQLAADRDAEWDLVGFERR